MIRIDAAQNQDTDAGAQEGEDRTGAARFSDDMDRREARNAGNDDTDDDLNDVRRLELGMNLVEAHGHEAVTTHGVKGTALGEEHAQDNRRQAADSAGADDGRTEVKADIRQNKRCRCCRIQHGIRDDAGHGRTNGDVEDRTDSQSRDDADRHIPFRILRFFGSRRQGVEAEVSEEQDGGPGEDTVDAIGQEGFPIHRFDMGTCQEEEQENRSDFNVDQNAVDVRTFADADDEQRRRQCNDEHSR